MSISKFNNYSSANIGIASIVIAIQIATTEVSKAADAIVVDGSSYKHDTLYTPSTPTCHPNIEIEQNTLPDISFFTDLVNDIPKSIKPGEPGHSDNKKMKHLYESITQLCAYINSYETLEAQTIDDIYSHTLLYLEKVSKIEVLDTERLCRWYTDSTQGY